MKIRSERDVSEMLKEDPNEDFFLSVYRCGQMEKFIFKLGEKEV